MGLLSTIGAASARAYGFTRSAIAAAVDAYFNRVTLLLPGNGTNGAQNNTFLDSSTNNFSITRNGNTTQGTFSPFSQTGWGNYFSSASGNISIASSANLASGTSSFTLEFWYNSTVTGNGRPIGNGSGAAFGTNNWVFAANNSAGKLEFYVYNYSSSTAMFSSTSTTVASDGQWHHIVLVRSSNTWAMFIDGSRQGSSVTSSVSFNGSSSGITIGYSGVSPETATAFAGYLSNVRFVNGSAVYDPTQTTLTVPTSALTAITNTSLLTCQSNRFVDNSTNAFAITVNGTPSVQAFSPFAPTAAYSATTNGGSGYFDGSGDYLTVADNTALEFGSGDFTVEAWVYLTATPGASGAMVASKGSEFNFAVQQNLKLFFSFFIPGQTDISGNTALPLNAWSHVAVSRSGSSFALFLNGARDATATNSSAISATANNLFIGDWSSGGRTVTGYMAGLRLVKGTAVYNPASTTYTVPTAPPTAITNTSLLANFTNGGIIDATGKNVLETVGNAQISTTQSKFGGSSMYFDGTGDYLNFPSSQLFGFGTGDLTIEFWLYLNTVSGTQNLCDFRNATTTEVAITLYMNGASPRLYVNGADRITGGNLSTGQWYHVALSRSGTSTKLFVDGTQSGSTYTDSNNYLTPRPLRIGTTNDGTPQFPLNAYVDDFRITRYARYTANFTPPTAAFPLQ